MASDLETKAQEAFIDDHFELALDLYSQAIQLNPKNAELYADRAQANIKLNNLTEDVTDANKAIELDPSMSKAYLRKTTACMKLEEYQTAKAALETGATLAPGELRFSNFCVCLEETDELPKQMLKEVTTNSVPAKEVEPVKDAPVQLLWHEFYQKPEKVVVTVFAKGIPRECVKVDYGEQTLSVSIEAPGKDAYHFQPRLFRKVLHEIHVIKILTSLEFSREVAVPQRVNVSSVSANQSPVYPSSKLKRVGWDKIEAQVKKEEKDERLDGDAALNKFSRDIYQDADEDTRRAMQKSFVESNGTVLSTNWKEVGAKKVEGSPPDGMEVKKWEY
ncbi:hypothetical protein Goshw_014344 [Gossypium schwendimanii]|uniref:Uncharacterized protein n=1 Tax=Gossypium schwendimanii TaxID=34291 RepID=A0A7J9KXB9_GOSSC|nr:hypothetical protein [Gossypium schwendimanii]